MKPQDDIRIHTTLAQRAAQGADAMQIAEAITATWQAIDVALRPILGQRGVAALYGRCLHLAGRDHPWLSGLHDDISVDLDFAALTSVLAHHSVAQAVASGGALLQALHTLMSSLVGASLTDQLLASVWAHLSGGSPAQDPSR